MPRIRKSTQRRKERKRIMKEVRGFRGQPGKQYRLAKEGRRHANVTARVGRKQKKRTYRGIWIIRLNAACRMRNIAYSRFIGACKKAGITLNRKMLSEIAIHDPAGFDRIVDQVRAAL